MDEEIARLVALIGEVVGESTVASEGHVVHEAYVPCGNCRAPIPVDDALADAQVAGGTFVCVDCRARGWVAV